MVVVVVVGMVLARRHRVEFRELHPPIARANFARCRGVRLYLVEKIEKNFARCRGVHRVCRRQTPFADVFNEAIADGLRCTNFWINNIELNYTAPNKVLNILESPRRRFFWGDSDNTKKISWVVWNKILRDKKNGGSGIGSLKALNLAMLSRWWWREKMEPNANWKMVVDNCVVQRGQEQKRDNMNNWRWQLEESGRFTVCSIRSLIDNRSLPPADQKTQWVKWVTSKVNIHLWRTLNDYLPTMDNLTKRGVTIPSGTCKSCNVKAECLNHVFGGCSTAKVDWWPVNEESVSGMWENIDKDVGLKRKVRRVIAAAFFWTLWIQRNSKVFKDNMKRERNR
ncbi:hypothetical protein OSB04_un000429 [Centaurea solstitialis]|uniref:Reverse transcriptase zinc-binding domain-containing protein n=1 Tax=Centaurea solstitialis TaxID=347529 RepID=A0AA38S693_9ASTR|nr:hypothetical protein OSB04_un000429 [Centaurea solstitialis]